MGTKQAVSSVSQRNGSIKRKVPPNPRLSGTALAAQDQISDLIEPLSATIKVQAITLCLAFAP